MKSDMRIDFLINMTIEYPWGCETLRPSSTLKRGAHVSISRVEEDIKGGGGESILEGLGIARATLLKIGSDEKTSMWDGARDSGDSQSV